MGQGQPEIKEAGRRLKHLDCDEDLVNKLATTPWLRRRPRKKKETTQCKQKT